MTQQPKEVSIEDQQRLLKFETDLYNVQTEQMSLLERVSLLELTSRQYEEQFYDTYVY